MPTVGSETEREPLLLGIRMSVPGRPLTGAIQTRLIRKRIKQLGHIAAAQLRQDADQISDRARAQELRQWARQLQNSPPTNYGTAWHAACCSGARICPRCSIF